jgi:hypothetical protein
LKKCSSNSLFFKEIKGHSNNFSQDYSDILNGSSANHSKNASYIHIDEEEYFSNNENKEAIKIIDYERTNFEDLN